MARLVTTIYQLLFVLFLSSLLSACSLLPLQPSLSLSCEEEIEREFSTSYEIHNYSIALNPGDQLAVTVEPIGDYLFTALELFEPAQDRIIFQTDSLRTNSYFEIN